jgi:CDP-paratose 2-epimerase
MIYLITGGCGFLGSNLASETLKRGHKLVIFDDLSRPGSAANLIWLKSVGEFSFIHGDIRNTNDVEKLISILNPDVVFHLAGQVAMTTSIENPKKDFEINAYGTINLLEALRKIRSSATVIYSSTNKVYGDIDYLIEYPVFADTPDPRKAETEAVRFYNRELFQFLNETYVSYCIR